MNQSIMPTSEPAITLPTGLLIGAVLGTAVLASSGWVVVTRLGGWAADVQVAGLAAGAVVALTGVLGTLVMKPWRARPISWWTTMCMVGMVTRLILTPALTFVLYSAVSLNAAALSLSVALAYLLVVVAEAAVLAGHVGQTLYPRADRGKLAPGSSVPGSSTQSNT